MEAEMTAGLLGQGLTTYVMLLLLGAVMTEPWRWAGVWLARDLDVESEVFRWVKAVSTALVAGLVARMVVFPIGALAEVAPWIRYAAFGAGLAVYVFAGRHILWGVLAGTATLLLATAWLGQ